MPITDPHVHYWIPEKFRWMENAKTDAGWLTSALKEYLPTHHMWEFQPLKLVKTVHVQANWHVTGENCVGETKFEQELAAIRQNQGHPHAIVSYAPLHRPLDAEKAIQRHMQYENFRGIRFMLDYDENTPHMNQTDRDYLNDPDFHAGLRLMEEHRGMIFDMQLCQSQLCRASDMCARFSELNFVLNHAGFPLSGETKRKEWKEGIRKLAQLENVWVKISGLGMWEGGWRGVDAISGHVEDVIDAFGSSRTMFASNFPVDMALDPDSIGLFDDFYRVVKDEMQLKDEDIEDMFHHNAGVIYKL